MNTKHTPGPWRQSTANPNAVNKDGEKLAIGIATTHGTDDSNYAAFFPSTDEARANALLIAAAPDMLEALKAWRYAYSECTGTDEERRDAKTKAGDMTRAAIAKATL
jgi:hypothetical protein